jgi:hypothetical protein
MGSPNAKTSRPQPWVGAVDPQPITAEALQEAMAKDFAQHSINCMTPDRGYPFPTDHVKALFNL